MIQRTKLLNYLADFLKVAEFDDYCINGLQIEGTDTIKTVVLGVSVSRRLFQQAIARRADMIIVHHGLFWKNDPSPLALTGIMRERVALLITNNINLAGYHLPLDAHPEIGNNAQIMKRLNIVPIQPVDVGFLGELPHKPAVEQLVSDIDASLGTHSQKFLFGGKTAHRVLVISGGSSGSYKQAIDHGADIFIGGDIKENLVREIEEAGLNYINAGHYNSEQFGIRALGEHLAEKFQLSCFFVDIPNPV